MAAKKLTIAYILRTFNYIKTELIRICNIAKIFIVYFPTPNRQLTKKKKKPE